MHQVFSLFYVMKQRHTHDATCVEDVVIVLVVPAQSKKRSRREKEIARLFFLEKN